MTIANEVVSVTATLASNLERNDFLYKLIGNESAFFELYLFNMMDTLTEDYSGDFWQFYQLSNGGFFMHPNTEKDYHIFVNGNGYDGIQDNVTVGITVTLMALSHYSFVTKNEQTREIVSDLFHKLRDYALDHKYASIIFAAID